MISPAKAELDLRIASAVARSGNAIFVFSSSIALLCGVMERKMSPERNQTFEATPGVFPSWSGPIPIC
jgi:hypothetical protein